MDIVKSKDERYVSLWENGFHITEKYKKTVWLRVKE